jgi:lipopolysaccharide transport protein LptA
MNISLIIYPFKSRLCRAVAALACVIYSTAVLAQGDDLRLPVSLDADSTAYDGKSSVVMFRGLRLTQGSLGISADEGYASKMDFEDSTWHFEGNVLIDVENGHIECDTADLAFSGYQLRTATITGSPAKFEMQRPGSEEKTQAQAGSLVYDFDRGIVEFSDQATITEGGNQISSSFLVYNILEQRINASSGGEGDAKVRITYTPGAIEPGDKDAESAEPPPTDPPETDDPSEETGERRR